ncbi:MAG: hypothetical protein LBP74_04120 [Treponema sp.]|jgi:hypothetical protein|nr:hypothetical protein [Treponema sp.]
MELKRSSASKQKPKPRLIYEGMLKAMPPDIVKELARRRLEEIKRYQDEKEENRKE